MTSDREPRDPFPQDDPDLYRAIVALSPQAVLVVDATARICYVNDAACRLSGHARDELLRMTVADLVVDPGRASAPERFRDFIAEGRYAGEVAIRHAEGDQRWWAIAGTRLDDTTYVGLATDVTERRRLADELERERQRLARAQEVAGVGWYEIDLEAGEVRASEQACAIYGVAPVGVISYDVVKTVPLPSERPRLDAAQADLIAGRAPYDVQFDIRRVADGERRRVHSLARYDEESRTVFGVLLDITSIKATAAALEQREAQLGALFDSARDMVFLKDRDLRYTHINRAAHEFLGRPAQDVIGRTDAEIFPAEYEQELQAIDQRVLAGEQDRSTVVRRLDDHEYVLETVRVPVRNAEGEVVGLCGVSRDVTETRRLEEQLHQAQKMEAVGRLAGGVAHDFNNLLTPILGYTNLLRDTLPADSPAQQDLAAIERAGLRARDLTASLLAFGRKQVVDMRPLSLNAVIGDAQAMLRRVLPESIQLRIDLEEEVQPVKADASQLQTVLVNLAVNAADAMPGGGELIIETRNVALDAAQAAEHPDAKPGPHVLLAVADDGHGMDAATRERIFEPFFTTKPVDGGTGLGLATVHGIVRQHRGCIEVDSEPAGGARFAIYLPRYDAESTADAADAVPDALRGDERVLVVEDDESVRQLAAAVLQTYGYRVTTVATPSAALELTSAEAEPHDLLLSDVVMPGMNGAQLHCRLRERWPDMPALFMSGYTRNVIAHHGVATEELEFIQKPFVPVELVRRVREILDGSPPRQRPQP